jgi:hypothetical protein
MLSYKHCGAKGVALPSRQRLKALLALHGDQGTSRDSLPEGELREDEMKESAGGKISSMPSIIFPSPTKVIMGVLDLYEKTAMIAVTPLEKVSQ